MAHLRVQNVFLFARKCFLRDQTLFKFFENYFSLLLIVLGNTEFPTLIVFSRLNTQNEFVKKLERYKTCLMNLNKLEMGLNY
jgi:hypothetical protein